MSTLFIVLVLAAVAVFAFVSWWFSEDQKIRRALKGAPRVDIRDAGAGAMVKIIGRVTPAGAQLTAPLSGRSCVLYDVLVEEYRSNGKSGSWYTLIRETHSVDFLLEDASGRAVVRTGAIRVHAEKDNQQESGFMNDATPELEAYLARHGKQSVGWVFNKRLRYREGVFEAGELVAALGKAGWERDPDPVRAGDGYRDAPKRLVIEPYDGAVIVSDEPKVTME